MRAFVVDDARAMRSILQGALEALGYEVTTVAGGREGLELLESSGCPDVMLVDWNMPEMDGIELVPKVRANPSYENARILMCTTETDVAFVNQAIEAGVNEYIIKPFTSEVLREQLKLSGAAIPA